MTSLQYDELIPACQQMMQQGDEFQFLLIDSSLSPPLTQTKSIASSDDAAWYWHEELSKSISPQQAKSILLDKIPAGKLVTSFSAVDSKSGVILHLTSSAEQERVAPFDLTLRYWKHPLSLELRSLTIPTVFQGNGIAKTLLRNIKSLADAINISSITLDAREVGSYAWVKYGFLPDQKSWDELRASPDAPLQKRLEQIPRLPQRVKSEINALLQSPDPKTIREISEKTEPVVQVPEEVAKLVPGKKQLPLGKALLIGMPWKGELDFNNQDQLRHFNDYTLSGQPARALN